MPRSRPRRVMTHLSSARDDLPHQLTKLGFECVPPVTLTRQRPPDVVLIDAAMSIADHPQIEALLRRRRTGAVLVQSDSSRTLTTDISVDARLPCDATVREVAVALDLAARLCHARRRWRKERRAHRRWNHLALHDALTGLPNRRAWNARIAASLASPQAFFVALVDVDFLKEVNDREGHDVGDNVLCAVAQTMKDFVSGDNFVARLGGDEFGLILRTAYRATADSILDRLHNAVTVDLARQSLPVKTLSRGCVGIPHDITGDASRIFTAAAQALQGAKQQRCPRAIASELAGL